MEFALIIKFILIGLMAFSAISYLFQRSGNKQNLKNAIESHQTTRQLNEDEYQLLKPYLDDKTKVKPYKYQSSLVNSDVSIITGSCVRHSLSTNGNESSYYFVIGSIEVFFPYGMDIYTLTDNVAEVVFTPGYAFVVNLNGYSLADAKAAQDAEELRNEQWQQGSRGEFKTVTGEDINHLEHVEQSDAGVSAFIAEAKNKRCEILEQREESPLEAQRKNQQNLGFLCAVFLILTVIMALTYEFDDDLWMIIISGISLVLALIFYVSKPKKTVHKINRVKGTVEDNLLDAKLILIGDSLILSYPKHWQDILPAKTTIDADMDVVVEEKSLLRYGHNLSISKEIEQYGPPKFWGRNCFIFIVGFALSLMIYLFSSSLKDDAIFSYRFASNQMTILDIKDNETLKKTTILSGDQVNLDLLGAWCDVEPSYGCKKAFVADEGIDIANIVNQVPNWAKKSFDGSLVATIRDEKVKALEQYSSLFVNGDSDYYSNNNKKNYTRLLNIEQLTLVTDEACATDNYSCSRLKDIFMILLTDENKKQLPTWSALVDYAKKQQNRSAIIYASNAQEIINLFSRLSEDFLHKQQESISKLLQQKQDEPNKVIIITVTNNHDANVIATGINQNKKNTTEYYIAIAGGLGQLELNGLVNDVSYHNDGSVASISINPDIRYQISDDQMIPAALITFISFMVIAIITLWQLLVMLNKIRINKYRLRHIQSDYRNLTL